MRGKRSVYLLGVAVAAIATAANGYAQAPTPATPLPAGPAAQQAAPATDTTVPGQVNGGATPTSPNAEPAAPGEIVVTANKREERLNRVGLSITAIGGEALAERRITSVQDIAAAVPGLKYAESGTATPIYTLRGIGFNEESLGVYPSVSVYTDEVPLPFPVLTLHAAFDLDRVEALKGPQGTLFGQNATGGAINYIAAKPTDILRYGGDISYGRFNNVTGNGFISGPLGENAGVRLAVSGQDADGWQYSLTRPRDRNGAQRWVAARLTLTWNPTSHLRLRATGTAWQDYSEPQAAQLIAVRAQNPTQVHPEFLDSPFGTRNPRSADWTRTADYTGFNQNFTFTPRTTIDLRPRSSRRFVQGALRADQDLGSFAVLTSITSYLDLKQNLYSDKDGSAEAVANIGPSYAQIHSFNQELRLANAGSGPLRWVLGGNYEKSYTHEYQNLSFGDGSSSNPGTLFINTTGSEITQRIRNYAGFANGEYDLTSTITLKAGGRYTNSRNRANICTRGNGDGAVSALFNIIAQNFTAPGVPFTPIGVNDCYPLNFQGIPGQVFTDTLAEHNFSWRGGVDFKPNSTTLFYANISRGYKAGSFPTLAGSVFAEDIPVKQESVTSYEAGFKVSSADRRIQLNGAGFYYDYSNKQIRGKIVDPIFDVLDVLINVPKSRIVGAEADLTVRPFTGLSLASSVTYLNSRVRTKDGAHFIGPTAYGNSCGTAAAPGPCDFTGSELPFTPKWSYSLNAEYRRPIGRNAMFVGADLRGQSSSVSTLNGRTIQFRELPQDRHDTSIAQPFIIPAYATVDARIGYEFGGGHYKVMLWGKNVFNKYYVTNVNHYLDATVRYVGLPATYGFTLSFRN